MVVLENRLFLNGVVYAVLHLVGRFFRLEVHKTACVFPVFQQMNNGIGRPLTFIFTFYLNIKVACRYLFGNFGKMLNRLYYDARKLEGTVESGCDYCAE